MSIRYNTDGQAFQIGDRVKTNKGGRHEWPFQGTIVDFGQWRSYPTAIVEKQKSKVLTQKRVRVLLKNLTKV